MTQGFQKSVTIQPAPGEAGDFFGTNPRAIAIAGPGQFVAPNRASPVVAGQNGLVVGNFCWVNTDTGDVSQSYQPGYQIGFLHRENNAIIVSFLAEYAMLVPNGYPITVYAQGDFWARFAAGAQPGQKVYADPDTGAPIAGGSTPATVNMTGSIGFSGTATVANGSNQLTVNTVVGGTLSVGDTITGAIAADLPANTTITALGTGTGGVGTYTMSANATATAGPEPITVSSTATVTYDQLRNAFVITSATNGVTSSVGFATADALTTGLLLTATTGAVLSAGAAAASPASSMNGVVASTQNWATFTHVFDPDNGAAGGPIKLAFSAWTSQNSPAGNERFAYAAWDTDDTPASNGADAACFAAQVKALGYNGTVPIWEPGDIQVAGAKAAFFCGAVASLDFTETQGRITFAFKSAAGLLADVTDATTAANLQANGYNYYGSWATANQDFTFFYPGSMPGAWKWADAYINQIAMNADFQLALMVYMTAVKTIPYVQIGYGGLRAALQDPISKYLNFGAIQAGVTLSASQIQQVNTAAGTPIDQVLASAGYYLQIKAASAQTRGNRQSPPMTFWYTDGGSVQQISMASIDVQ